MLEGANVIQETYVGSPIASQHMRGGDSARIYLKYLNMQIVLPIPTHK